MRLGAEPVGHQAGLAARPRRPRPTGSTCASARSTPGWPGACPRAAPRHRRVQRRRHRPATRRRHRLEPAGPRRARHPRVGAAHGRGLDRRRRRRRPPCPGARPSPASPATSRRRCSGRGASRPGRPRSPSAPAACSTRAWATTDPPFDNRGERRKLPDRRLAGGRPARPGASRRSCCRPAPTSSGCATTSASSPPRPRPTRGRACDDHRRRVVRAGPARAGHARSGTTAPGARCSA